MKPGEVGWNVRRVWLEEDDWELFELRFWQKLSYKSIALAKPQFGSWQSIRARTRSEEHAKWIRQVLRTESQKPYTIQRYIESILTSYDQMNELHRKGPRR